MKHSLFLTISSYSLFLTITSSLFLTILYFYTQFLSFFISDINLIPFHSHPDELNEH